MCEKFICITRSTEVTKVMAKTPGRNWTIAETNLFCSVLVDPLNQFMISLEKKALKKSSTKEVFEEILKELKKTMDEEPFKTINEEALSNKKVKELNLDYKKLQVKYNNLKRPILIAVSP